MAIGLTRNAALAAVLAAALAQPTLANDKAAAAIAAGVAGVAIGAALANSAHHHHHDGGSFSPKPGVTCHRKTRACYHDDGSFAANATWEYFG